MLKVIKKLSQHRALCLCAECQKEYECNPYDARKSRIGHLCSDCKNITVNLTEFTQADLLKVFSYNSETGELTYKLKIGNPLATYKHSQGYLSVCIGKQYLAHRIIWFMQTGEMPTQIDHINHIRDDNRWVNLRNVTNRTNHLNTSLSSNNTSGFNGVRILPSGRYNAFIMVQRKQISLGTYDTLEEAIAARQAANSKYGFHVNHGS